MEVSATRKVAYNTIVQIIARAITTVISLLAITYLSRYLGVVGYGQYGLIFAYLSLFGVLVDFGFFLLQVREVSRRPQDESFILGNVMGLKIALGVVVFTVAYILARFLYDNPIIYTGILIGVVSQWALALHQVPVSLFQARLQMHKVAIVNVAVRLAYLGAILWGVQADVGVLGVVAIIAVLNLAVWLGQTAWASQLASLAPRWNLDYWWTFLKEAWPLGVAVVLAMIYFKIDTIMLQAMKGDYAVGIYTLPYKIIEVVLTVPTVFMSSVVPVFVRFWSEQPDRARAIFKKAFDAMALASLPLAAGAMIAGTQLMVAVGGVDFEASGTVLKILIWTTSLSFMGAVFNYSMIAAGYQRLMVWPYLSATIFNVVANFILIPRYSYIGAAFATVATEVLVLGWVAWLAWRWVGLMPNLVVLGKSALAAGTMAGLLWWLGSPNLLLNIVFGAVIYIGMLVVLKALNREIVKEIIRLK
jgi:O-antigen/teichoic acid export membrane protein